MALEDLSLKLEPIPGAMPASGATIAPGELRGVCEKARAQKARLVALWGSDETASGAGYALHLALVLLLGLYIPPYLVDWYRQAAALIG